MEEPIPSVNPNIISNSLTEVANENADKQSYASIPSKQARNSPTTSILTKNQKLKTRQESEESRTRSHRSLHPAIRQKQQMFILSNEKTKQSSYKKGPHALNTLRRISKADFSSVRRAGKS